MEIVAAIDQEEHAAAEAFPDFDLLWHYACVGDSPPSAAAQFLPARLPDQPAAGCRQRLLLQRVFRSFDHDGDGLVSIHEIARICDALGIPQKEESICSLLACLPTKLKDHLDEGEFFLLYDSSFNAPATMPEGPFVADADANLLQAFCVFDKDGNGFISPTELQSVLCSLGFTHASQLQDCVEMIARVDDNADGQVDFFEFKRLFDMESNLHLIATS